MKKLFSKALPVAGLSFMLAACFEKVSISYFLEHPRELQKQLHTCMNTPETTNATFVENCKMAVSAEAALREYLQAEQNDPEKFGERILTAQYDLSLLVQKITETKNALKQANDDQKKLMLNNQLDDLKKAKAIKEQEIKMLLAIAGLNSPE